ncbi:MAG TPA: Zn-dependent hydrolase [Gemmatimonadaceae bacterium]|nr:Zn-dependent hydrolase [Gemmatimonadaceae bacterium]
MTTRASIDLPRVNGARLLADLDALAHIGGTAAGGVSRPAYGDDDVAARSHVRELMRRAGLTPRVDAGGNSWGRRAGSDGSTRGAIVIGSHTDTVPDGGRYDGALGVAAALEVARTIAECRVKLRHPLEVVDFQNEEGGLVGSKIVAGKLRPDELTFVATSGRTLGDGIRALGGDPERLGEARLAPGSVAAYLELHIEQGRVLERAGADVGVVEGLVAISYWEVTFEGVASHAGTTPMADRHDALLAAARFVDAVNAVVVATPGRHVGTVGRLAVFPGGANVIPGRVVLTLELRDLDPNVIAGLFARIEREGARIAAATGTTLSMQPTLLNAPAPTHPLVRDAVAAAARDLGLRPHLMPSGAGHDAQNMTAIGPSGMIFVPSVNGISHSPAERTEDADVINGANVLLGAVLRLDAML